MSEKDPVVSGCVVCGKEHCKDVVSLEGLTPGGSFSYVHRLNDLLGLDRQTGNICKECAHFVDQLEKLQLQIFEIENTLFSLHTRMKLEDHQSIDMKDVTSNPDEESLKVNSKQSMKKSGRRQLEGAKEVVLQKCISCNRSFRTKFQLSKHSYKVHQVEMGLDCAACSSNFQTFPELESHHKRQHTENVSCQTCGKTVKKENIVKHEKIHKRKEEYRDRLCDICCRAFATLSNLNAHMKIHSSEKMHPCNKCDRAFTWSSSLETHIQAAHVSAVPVHKCSVCNRGFKNKPNLQKHELTHNKDKPYNCDVCDKGFIRRDLYTRHIEHCS